MAKRKLLDTKDESTSKRMKVTSKKMKVTSPEEYVPNFDGVTFDVMVYPNMATTIAEAGEGLTFPFGLFDHLIDVDNERGGSPKKFKERVVIVGDDAESWDVQLTYAEDYIFTIKMSKPSAKKELLEFVAPCSYKGYPLLIEDGKVEFPTFSVGEGCAAWSSTIFQFNKDYDEYPYFTLFIDDFDNNETILLMDFHLEGIYKALGKPANKITNGPC